MSRILIFLLSVFLSSLGSFQANAAKKVPSQANRKIKCELTFEKLKLCGQIKWITPPKRVEMPTEKDRAEAVLSFENKDHTPLTGEFPYEVHVKLFMPSMGHGSLPTQVTPEVGEGGKSLPGVYRVKDLYFSMPGDWEIQVDLRKAGKRVDRAVLPYQL